MLEARRAELHPWVLGYHPAEGDQVTVALADMFSSFTSMSSMSPEEKVAKIGLLLRSLVEFPLWAIERACDRIRTRGFVKKERDGRYVTERHWPPTDAELIAAVEEQMKHYRPQYDAAVALLSAKVEDR